MGQMTAHVAIEYQALKACGPDCRCAKRPNRPGRRINRRLCEPKYQTIVQQVIRRFLDDDPC